MFFRQIEDIKSTYNTNFSSVQKTDSVKVSDDSIFVRYNEMNKNKIMLDGKVGNFRQAYGVGDCWLLAPIIALNNTEAGKEVLKNLIKPQEDGTVKVRLEGVNKEYTISAKEIRRNKPVLAQGDDDVVVIELAVKRYRRELINSGNFTKKLDPSYKDYCALCIEENPLASGNTDEAIFLLTGKKPTAVSYTKEQFSDKDILNLSPDKILDLYSKDPQKYACCLGFGIHGYAVVGIEGEKVILRNPFEPENDIKMNRQELVKKIIAITCTKITD